MLGEFKYHYQLVDNTALNNMIMDESKPFYYLVYIKSSTDKYIAVENSLSGEMIYSKYSPVSYNIKSKDFGKLESAIE